MVKQKLFKIKQKIRWQKSIFQLNAFLLFLPEPDRDTQTISTAKEFRQKQKKKTISSDADESPHEAETATKYGENCISTALE